VGVGPGSPVSTRGADNARRPGVARCSARAAANLTDHSRRGRHWSGSRVLRGAWRDRGITRRRRRLLPGGRHDPGPLGARRARRRQRRGRWRRLGRRHPRPQRRVLGRRSTGSLPKPQLREPRSGRAGAPTVWGGYSGIFIDPDGHACEIAHTPAGSSATTGPFGSIDRRATRPHGLRTTRIAAHL
jgi:hypothetical protein